LIELLISGILVIHDLFHSGISFLLLSDLLQLIMLLCHLIILFILIIFPDSLFIFSLDLPVELLSDQAFSLLVSEDLLFLFFVVQQGIELLDGCPFVILVDLREDFGGGFFRADVGSSVSSRGLPS